MKRHLLVRRDRTACGLSGLVRSTSDPGEVNCKSCLRSVHVADLELRQSTPTEPKRLRRNNSRKENP